MRNSLGALAPSPALSAKREPDLRHRTREHRLLLLLRARAPAVSLFSHFVQTRLISRHRKSPN
jgi:hypothetical protein